MFNDKLRKKYFNLQIKRHRQHIVTEKRKYFFIWFQEINFTPVDTILGLKNWI